MGLSQSLKLSARSTSPAYCSASTSLSQVTGSRHPLRATYPASFCILLHPSSTLLNTYCSMILITLPWKWRARAASCHLYAMVSAIFTCLPPGSFSIFIWWLLGLPAAISEYNIGMLEMASVYRKGRFEPYDRLIGSVPAECWGGGYHKQFNMMTTPWWTYFNWYLTRNCCTCRPWCLLGVTNHWATNHWTGLDGLV